MTASRTRFRLISWGAPGVVALAQLACGPSYQAPAVTPALAKTTRAPVSELARGYELHQLKCAKCHAFEDPADYTPDELREDIMPVMARKAKLTAADEKAVLAYLLAARSASAE